MLKGKRKKQKVKQVPAQHVLQNTHIVKIILSSLLTNKVNDKNKISIQAYRDFSKSSNQEQVSIQGHRYTKTRGAYAHCLLYASSVFRPGQTSRSQYPFRATIMGIYSLDLIYLQSPAIQVKHQDSDLPAMVIDLIYLQSPAIQVKHQDSDLPAMGIVLNPPRSCFTDPDSVRGYRPNSKDQNSNLGYRLRVHTFLSVFTCFLSYWPSVFTIRLHNEKIVFLPVRQVYTSSSAFSYCWLYFSTGFTVQASHHGSYIRPVLQSRPATNHLCPCSQGQIQRSRIRFPSSFTVPLLSMPMIPNPSPIQSDRATIKDPISIHVFTAQVEEQGFHLHPRLQIILVFTQSKPNYKASVARPGSPSFNRQVQNLWLCSTSWAVVGVKDRCLTLIHMLQFRSIIMVLFFIKD
ncbi:hypothetical protein F4703DRAFT_1919716 [Phycomyces blakesleeanus]